MREETLDVKLKSVPRRGGALGALVNKKVKKFVFDHTPQYLEDLVKVFAHEAISLANYGKMGMFSNIAIETTSVCDRRCSYCPVSNRELYNSRAPKPMADKTFSNVIDQLAQIGYKGNIALQHYGEPLLDKKIDSRIAYARKKLPEAFIVMNSHGDHLTPERLKSLVASGLDLIHVTNHNQDGTIHKNLQATLEYLQNHPELAKHFRMRGGVSKFYNRGGLIQIQKPEQMRRLTHCVDESYSANVDADGDVVLCANDYVGDHQYGNVNQKSIIDIWYGKSFTDLRSRKKRGHFDLDICKSCVGEK